MKDMLETNVPKEFGANEAMVNEVVGLIVALIMVVAVAIPISTQVIAAANLTGIAATIVGFVPTFLALGALVLVAATLVSKS